MLVSKESKFSRQEATGAQVSGPRGISSLGLQVAQGGQKHLQRASVLSWPGRVLSVQGSAVAVPAWDRLLSSLPSPVSRETVNRHCTTDFPIRSYLCC